MDAAALKEAEAVTSEVAKDTKTEAMVKEQEELLQSAE
jgi:hypothetical protein